MTLSIYRIQLLLNMEKLNKIIFDFFKLAPDEIKDSLTAKDVPDWDSMNYLLFIAELEKQFDVSFTMDEVLNAKSLGAVKDVLRSKGVNV